ncbi:hypothetical protein roselon_03476 [Roseibacterium elongatum DSM 19469]|uniref:Uncharacterized protein n=1 Tax=Roseicyclus elongatus DSM 19469 TaxID=1294273 RepID=W8S9P5_9RHOB|nr:hypothetical protein [Roseibacterium elongatum]AHM05731.1 hypothetical protein roselon_03476 [Roseibacterium elongatum DSM 19469]
MIKCLKGIALILAAVVAQAGTADAQQIREGRYHPDNCPSGMSDMTITLSAGRIAFWESTCTLMNPVPVRDMGAAVLYDAQCQGEGQTWTRRYLLMPGFRGDLVLVGEGWSQTYVYCGP